MKDLYPNYKELTVAAGYACRYHIIGTVWEDNHDHMIVNVEVQMYGLPHGYDLAATAAHAGWALFPAIVHLYLTKEVPPDIVWQGQVVPGICMN